jgi:hypothetical protein
MKLIGQKTYQHKHKLHIALLNQFVIQTQGPLNVRSSLNNQFPISESEQKKENI